MNVLLQLLFSFFQVGLMSFGGGMAAITLVQQQVVQIHGWITLSEFADLISIAEMTPGPIAINSATFIGIHLAGIPGALIATLGCILPSSVIVFILAWLYFKYQNLGIIQSVLGGIRPVIVALIASAGITILMLALFNSDTLPAGLSGLNIQSVALFVLSFILLRVKKPQPVAVILGCGFVGILVHLVGSIV